MSKTGDTVGGVRSLPHSRKARDDVATALYASAITMRVMPHALGSRACAHGSGQVHLCTVTRGQNSALMKVRSAGCMVHMPHVRCATVPAAVRWPPGSDQLSVSSARHEAARICFHLDVLHQVCADIDKTRLHPDSIDLVDEFALLTPLPSFSMHV